MFSMIRAVKASNAPGAAINCPLAIRARNFAGPSFMTRHTTGRPGHCGHSPRGSWPGSSRLVPAIHDLQRCNTVKTWMPATSAGMTEQICEPIQPGHAVGGGRPSLRGLQDGAPLDGEIEV